MKNKKVLPWLPGILCEVAAIVFCIIYAAGGGREATMYLQLIAAALLPFLVPVYSLISKKPLTPALSVAAAVFVFLASDLGSGLYFYAFTAKNENRRRKNYGACFLRLKKAQKKAPEKVYSIEKI